MQNLLIPWQRMGVVGSFCLVVVLASGCAHTISRAVREQAEPMVSLAQLRANPEAYKDRTVILGGEIQHTSNVPEGTLLEVVQKPLDATERPLFTDQSEGRFMALCDRYLDPAVYTSGREITVAGRVVGTRTGRIGAIDYVYPLLSCFELYLWPRPVYRYPTTPYPWSWEPWPWDPWSWRPYRRYWRPYGPYW